MFDGTHDLLETTVTRRSFLRGSALFAAAIGLGVAAASTASAQEPQQPEGDQKPADPSQGQQPGGDGEKVDSQGREYRDCPQCGSHMYREGRTWTCENCGYSYVE